MNEILVDFGLDLLGSEPKKTIFLFENTAGLNPTIYIHI